MANVAQKSPDEAAQAIPKLLTNTKDKGTVVRWSAAYALTEIAKNHPASAKKLIPQFEMIVKKEENNGVKNVYLRALKVIGEKNERSP